jgi:hypothetical protein
MVMIQSSSHEKKKKTTMAPTINFESLLKFSCFNKMEHSTVVEAHNENAFQLWFLTFGL